MHKWKKYAWIILTLMLLVISYFLRDFIFINANSQIKYLTESQHTAPHLVMNWTHSKMEAFFQGWSIQHVNTFKWMMTISFTGIFSLLSATGIWLVASKKMAWYTLLFFGGLFFLSFAVYFLGNYRVSRDLIGIMHSPLPFLLMLGVSSIQPYFQANEKSDSV